jgi:hypothetical protein
MRSIGDNLERRKSNRITIGAIVTGSMRLFLAGLACFVLLVAALFFGTRHYRSDCYDHPPSHFFAQMNTINKGMSEGDVLKCVTIFDRIEREPGRLLFFLDPEKTNPISSILSPPYFILIEFDEQGTVFNASTGDYN